MESKELRVELWHRQPSAADLAVRSLLGEEKVPPARAADKDKGRDKDGDGDGDKKKKGKQAAVAAPPSYPAIPMQSDRLVGVATVPLTSFVWGFTELSGWYHLMDFKQQVGRARVARCSAGGWLLMIGRTLARAEPGADSAGCASRRGSHGENLLAAVPPRCTQRPLGGRGSSA
jgi:hypothetical protein